MTDPRALAAWEQGQNFCVSFTSRSFQVRAASILHQMLETQLHTEMLSLLPWDSHAQVSDGIGR